MIIAPRAALTINDVDFHNFLCVHVYPHVICAPTASSAPLERVATVLIPCSTLCHFHCIPVSLSFHNRKIDVIATKKKP